MTPPFAPQTRGFRRNFLTLLLAVVASAPLSAQELDCQVSVIAPTVNNVETSVFEQLETAITEFMNGRRWTTDEFTLTERVTCTMQITINKANSQTNFEGTIQVQSSRPVYNSNYNAPLLMVNDNDFDFTYAPGTMLQYSPDQFRDNLTSVLAFYAYLILAMDYDSFALEGGTNWYTQAQTVVTNAQGLSSPPAGWSAADGKQSRYALIDNILSQTFRPLRRCYYEYHRIGLDNAFDDPASSRQAMSDALISLRNVHRIRPANYNLQTFFQAKKDEIVKMFGVAPDGERARLLPVLKLIDPGNIPVYDQGLG
ncbi:MAG: DUF4835 family protein [Bacteroidota bacterium]|jgi:hypothetical protein|nr:DUF4835 family protein [Bacteroidota bacterium]MEC8758329.1 DUF4835 family protein [Bacteroidota bacterium]